jgi:hypothetical protein
MFQRVIGLKTLYVNRIKENVNGIRVCESAKYYDTNGRQNRRQNTQAQVLHI